MTRRRFFVPASEIRDGVARLPADEIHHIQKVLRLVPGTGVEIFDGEGNCYAGTLERDRSELHVGGLIRLEVPEEAALDCTLALALIRAERFEWALEKATELGVGAIIPLHAGRSQVRMSAGGLAARAERWRRIVRSAAKQSGRATVPEISEPATFEQLLHRAERSAARLILVERASIGWPEIERGRVLVAVGPEGGWESSEVAAAERAGWRPVGLGPRILRAETAAIAALAILQFATGERTMRSEDAAEPARP